jgi:hypothetical protein
MRSRKIRQQHGRSFAREKQAVPADTDPASADDAGALQHATRLLAARLHFPTPHPKEGFQRFRPVVAKHRAGLFVNRLGSL